MLSVLKLKIWIRNHSQLICLKIINRIIIHVHCINLNKFDFKWNGKELLKAHDILWHSIGYIRNWVEPTKVCEEKSYNFQHTSNALDRVRKTRVYLASMNILKSKDIFCVHVQALRHRASSIELLFLSHKLSLTNEKQPTESQR